MWWWVLAACGLPEGTVDQAVPAPPGASLVREARQRRQEEIEAELEKRRAARSEVVDPVVTHNLPLGQWGRAKPHEDKAGEPDGFEISGIASGTPAAQLGFKNGDVLHSVDGQPIPDRAAAEKVWQALKEGSGTVTVALTRRKKAMSVAVDLEVVKAAVAMEDE